MSERGPPRDFTYSTSSGATLATICTEIENGSIIESIKYLLNRCPLSRKWRNIDDLNLAILGNQDILGTDITDTGLLFLELFGPCD